MAWKYLKKYAPDCNFIVKQLIQKPDFNEN
ncbi:MAG: hypothetical protein JWQ54_2562 [Mucilaginibacter sp.]|nr:hypothetical protein [Mucilaginibacter sp.]